MDKAYTQNNSISPEDFKRALDDPSLADKLALQYPNAIELAWEMLGEGDHRACALLYRAAKKKAVKERLQDMCRERTYLRMGLCSDNPKMRKNTAKLIGVLGDESDAECLVTALNEERVRMVIPSVILALGAVGGECAKEALLSYKVRAAEDETEIKHENEEREALKKALSGFEAGKRHIFTDFSSIDTVYLVCASPMGKYVAEDCKREGICVRNFSDTVVAVHESDINKIYRVRSFRELLIHVCGKGADYTSLKDKILHILNNTHEQSNAPFRFRVEYRGHGDRKAEIKRILSYIECEELVNSVSDYEAEVRVYDNGIVRLKLYTYDDNRFSYRKKALAASISPANAASVMSYARQYLTDDASVLDMCCGSGTMLFERYKALKCRRIMGVDISKNAIDAAKENARHINPRALFYNLDCARFTLREPVDEIVSNLPFGNRVGTHGNNERLYRAIFVNMKAWLRQGGIALLYTMEAKLVLSAVKETGAFELVDMIKTEAGGLMPAVIILRRK